MDLNVRAFRVVQAALSDEASPASKAKKEASRRGGLVGGQSRAQRLGRERRIEIAKTASRARWSRKTTDLPTE